MEQASKRIARWMKRQNRYDYFIGGIIEPDFAKYTQFGEDCSAELDFEEGSEEDELCFEMAVIELDRYAASIEKLNQA